MKDIIIVGAGGIGSEVTWIIEEINAIKPTWNIIGFVDDNIDICGKYILGYRVIGGINFLIEEYKLLKYEDRPLVVIAIANYEVKKDIVEMLNKEFKFATLIHPDVFIHRSNSIGEGSIVYPAVIMTVDIKIGKHVIVSPKCGIGHNSRIHDYVSLLWNVNISGFNILEEGVMIGSGATVIQNKLVGGGALVGAGAVVIENVSNKCTVIGVPAKLKRELER